MNNLLRTTSSIPRTRARLLTQTIAFFLFRSAKSRIFRVAVQIVRGWM
jgi:hypothetical protein